MPDKAVSKARLHIYVEQCGPYCLKQGMHAHDDICLQVATMVRADWLFLLTDVPCLYTANPSTDPSAEPIYEVRDIAALQVTFPALSPHLSSPL